MRHQIAYKEQYFSAPSKWEEVNATDLLRLAQVTALRGATSCYQDLLVCKMFNMPVKLFLQFKAGERLQLCPLMNWIFRKNTMKNWVMPVIKAGKTKLYGPKNKLSDLTAEEFMFCEAAYERWIDDNNPEHLDMLVAVLYRKHRFFSPFRQKFDDTRLDKNIRRIVKVKNFVKNAIAINYAGCRNLVIDKHPNIWQKAAEESEKNPNRQQITSWRTIIMDLAGDKFGTFPETLKTKMWDVLADLDKKVKTVKDMEAKR